MRRFLLLHVAIAIVALGAEDAKETRIKKELAQLQGVWRCVSIEFRGEVLDIPPEMLDVEENRFVVKGAKLVNSQNEGIAFSLNPTTNPKIIDFRIGERIAEGIYKVDGDRWTICESRAKGQKDRPTAFSTAGQPNWILRVYKRVKDD